MSELLVSLIICTRNRREILDRCLGSLLPQAFRREELEVLVVDSASSDDTPGLLDEYCRTYPRLRRVREEVKGLSRARNRGWSEAGGRYLTYLDDDAMIPDGYVDNLVSVLHEHQPDLLGGPIYPYYTSPKPSWFRDEYEIRRFEDRSGFSATCRVSGGNYTIRRDLLERLGLFDTNLGMNGDMPLIGEERQVLEKYRASTPKHLQKVYYSLECSILHHTPAEKMTVKGILARYFISGRTMQHIFKYDRKFVVNHVVAMPGKYVRRIASEVWSKGVRDADYVDIIRFFFYDLGVVWQYLVAGRRASRKS